MPQKYRLSRSDFTKTRGFKRLNGVFFSLSYGTIPGRAAGGAIVVSKKVAKTAVARNTIKRRGRSVLLPVLREMGLVLILVARGGAAKASFADLRSDVASLVAKIR